MAWEDDQGYVYIVDRRTDMIISGGENVYPIEIEHVVSAHDDVLDVAVIGVPDDRWGEAVKAVVSLRSGAKVTERDILQFCRGKLAGYKMPKSVDFIQTIPRNASGKILKKELREKYWAGRSRRV
jgi:acyl-CoA synthetase (AMP-forming)/AMP-acid ligase II